MIILLYVTWYLFGVWGFIFWWTKNYDFEVSSLMTAILVGFCGPFAWGLGYLIQGGFDSSHILIKKRKEL